LLLFEMVLAVFMGKHTPKYSPNSSLHSSRTDKEDADAQAGAKAMGQSARHTRSDHSRTVETVIVIPVAHGDHGGEDPCHLPAQSGERRTRIDIVFEKVVSHVEAEIKSCPPVSR
jgi:transposase